MADATHSTTAPAADPHSPDRGAIVPFPLARADVPFNTPQEVARGRSAEGGASCLHLARVLRESERAQRTPAGQTHSFAVDMLILVGCRLPPKKLESLKRAVRTLADCSSDPDYRKAALNLATYL